MAPLTIIFGANSAGKSSLGHLLLALKQTTLLSDRKRALHLGDKSSLIDLGTFSDCINGHDLNKTLSFTLGWQLKSPLLLNDPLKLDIYTGDGITLTSKIKAGKNDQPEVQGIEYELTQSGSDMPVLKVEHGRNNSGKVALTANPLNLVKAQGRVWNLEPPEKFYRF